MDELLSPEELQKLLMSMPDWQIDQQVTTIARTWQLEDFSEAVSFVNQIAEIAEEENHHPDIFLHGYKNVTVSLTTHSIGGLTDKDFTVASRIDGVAPRAE